MEECKKEAPAVTKATGRTTNFSDAQRIPLQCHEEGLIGTGVILLHPTLESALRESQARIPRL